MGKKRESRKGKNLGKGKNGVDGKRKGEERIVEETRWWKNDGEEKRNVRERGHRRERIKNEEVGATIMAFCNVAKIECKDREFWKGIKEWEVLVKTWLEKKAQDRVREFKWKVQIARGKTKKAGQLGEC